MTKTRVLKTMMTIHNIESFFREFDAEMSGRQKMIPVKSPLGVYYGISNDGFLRLAFLSKYPSAKMESTRMIRITQGAESDSVYWTCFDLLQHDAKDVFFTFCANIIESVSREDNEKAALETLKRRYMTWKAMFKNEIGNTISREKLQGLFGELFFLKNSLIGKYGVETAINGWGGPEDKSKDFSIGKDWFEIKTVGENVTTVKISSLSQLSSENIGHLIIIRIEIMSDEFDNGESSIGDLFRAILNQINDESTEATFLSKLSSYGYDVCDESFKTKFDAKSVNSYLVDDAFPRITVKHIDRKEICDVKYSLYINALKEYLED